MATYYSLDNAISAFFETNTSATREQCDEFTLSRAGGQVDPVQIQGTFSYTVTAGTNKSKIFQFRIQDFSIDMEIMKLAKTVHPQLVAGCKYHGTIGGSRPIHIYEMDNLPGTAYIMARNISVPQPADAVSRHRSTVKDLASHGDLCEMNLLVNSNTGKITGIVDWAEAAILPFGFSLWGFENVLGYMDSEGWHYYDNRRELEHLFWQTFLEEARNASKVDLQFIRAARTIGLFCRYGFIVEGKVVQGMVDLADASSLAYLDAFCTIDDWAPGARAETFYISSTVTLQTAPDVSDI
ncbi:hypothetical protein ColLi_13116 [Colletotrichum liriopes]|uniref:Aminoglycoside phosphotransferase domain-containing protein n=1 Tax=Colletotrichum liriopes TaxID=708192 RepID=A0AA37H2A7_9PEZI|nr:hypothetical protein ColLi_13116 [Colletotrichum liriopes]